MAVKRVIQVYKAPGGWLQSPPGVGDFVRGGCHLFERLQGTDAELRLDVSQTGFAGLIEQDASIFHAGEAGRVAGAEEFFEDHEHEVLEARLDAFLASSATEFYLSTNLGAWDRVELPDHTRRFIEGFYRFTPAIEERVAAALPPRYAVLSVRGGDHCYDDPNATLPRKSIRLIDRIVETHLLPRAEAPVVVTSDCHSIKMDLARRYGFSTLPHRSRHGAFGQVEPVAMDLCMLKHSTFNCHINVWADWWSGFSHYTAMIFRTPSINFRAPRFACEEVTAEGRLLAERAWWQRLMPSRR